MKARSVFRQFGRRCSLGGQTWWLALWLSAAGASWAAELESVNDYADQITHAGLFLQPLIWVGRTPPDINETRELWQAAGLDPSHQPANIIAALETFIRIHPDSPWTPSLEANLARYDRSLGRYSAALDYWQKAWQATKDLSDSQSRMVADYTLAYWSQLLSSLGRVKELEALVRTVNNRTLSTAEFQKQFDLARQGLAIMQGNPGASYRCGTLALFNVAKALNASTDVLALAEMDSPPTGFSLAQLMELSRQYHLNLTAVKRPPASPQLVVPSVVHWKENHYAAIVAESRGGYKVIDPTFGRPQWLSAAAINENADGYFLVPANRVPHSWSLVATNEAAGIWGKGVYVNGIDYPPPPPCPGNDPAETCPQCGPPPPPPYHPPGAPPFPPSLGGGGPPQGPGCSTCSENSPPLTVEPGMPTWDVQEPYISLWLHDQPMVYNLSIGRPFVLGLDYHQRETRSYNYNNTAFSNFGPNWNCNLLTYIQVNGSISEGWVDNSHWSIPDDTNSTWIVEVDPVTTGGFQASDFAPGGGERDFYWNNTNQDNLVDPRSHIQFIPSDYQTTYQQLIEGSYYTFTNIYFASNVLAYPNGSSAAFGLVVTVSQFPRQEIALLTSLTDPQGHVMTYSYSTNNGRILLTQVTDFDGHTNLFLYGNSSFPTAVTEIINTAYGLTVSFHYDANGLLTNIVDVAGLSSSFQYLDINDTVSYWSDPNETNVSYVTTPVTLLTALQTPYGTTSFDYFRPSAVLFGDTPDANINRAITITQPDGGKHLFLYKDDGNENFFGTISYCSGSSDYNENQNIFTMYRPGSEMVNDYSYYWGPRQYAALSTTVLTNLQFYDFFAARMCYWLHFDAGQGVYAVSPSLGAALGFNPDPENYANYAVGGEPDWIGLATWYGYEGTEGNIFASTNDDLPVAVCYYSQVDGFRQFQNITRNQFGYPTAVVDFGADGFCNTYIKTNLYIYADNGMDLLKHIGPDGVVQESYAYDGHHRVLAFTNALGEVTRYTYNAREQLTSTIQPNGLVTTNIYGPDGFLAQQIVVGFSTNSYTYTNGLVRTHTDERGLTVTNTWDQLQRLIRTDYPDGTSVSYIYSNLDLVRVVDRLGFVTSYVYDNMRRKIYETNADNAVTYYNYCNCGALNFIQDALGNRTWFYYDCAGRLTNTVYPDGYSVSYAYNSWNKVLATRDSSNRGVARFYDAQMRLIGVTNVTFDYWDNMYLDNSQMAYTYDIDDRLTNSVDANGVSVGMTYDSLGRLLTRTYPDGGVEAWGYTPNISGPTSYTNQIGNVTRYGYDLLGRKIAETNALNYVTAFGYNAAGDLLWLTDGNGHKTTWNYDQYGRVTNKWDHDNHLLFAYQYDDDNRLTNRWTPAKGSTVYSYDPVGNLTHIAYPVSPSISLAYDPLNRLTNMVDAVGQTVYTYDAAGQLLSEDGPWADDTVSYSYQDRLRQTLSVAVPNGSPWTQRYVYDYIRRLASVTTPAGEFDYDYGQTQPPYWIAWYYPPSSQQGSVVKTLTSGSLVHALSLPNGAYITNTYDANARLLSTALLNGAGTNLDSYAYGYNAANQRTNVVRAAGDYVLYYYDAIGELKQAMSYDPGGSNRFLERFMYNYDGAGNLLLKLWVPLTTGRRMYTVNELNQITNAVMGLSILGNPTVTVSGATTGPATNVTVNGVEANLHPDGTFDQSFTVTNGRNVFVAVARDAYGRQSTNVSAVNVQVTNSAYTYDLNGNLLSDGTRNFAYDDENELISVWQTNVWREDYVYDGKLRRRITRQFTWNGSGWQLTNEVHYVYDGNVVIQERDQNNLPVVSYTRGVDLSGTLQGAGGIGGLLARTDMGRLTVNDPLASAYYHADGNGNITALITDLMDTNQVLVAKYLYDPYGNLLAESGPLAGANKYRFSSQEWDSQAGLYYYLYRFYDPNLQRWLNRDPLGELGFNVLQRAGVGAAAKWDGDPNLYDFVANNPKNSFDPFGLWQWGWPPWGNPPPPQPGNPPTLDVLTQLLKGIKDAWDQAQHGKCPKNPCLSVSSVVAGICQCLFNAMPNVDSMADCVCLTSPDPDCAKKAKEKINKVFGNH